MWFIENSIKSLFNHAPQDHIILSQWIVRQSRSLTGILKGPRATSSDPHCWRRMHFILIKTNSTACPLRHFDIHQADDQHLTWKSEMSCFRMGGGISEDWLGTSYWCEIQIKNPCTLHNLDYLIGIQWKVAIKDANWTERNQLRASATSLHPNRAQLQVNPEVTPS